MTTKRQPRYKKGDRIGGRYRVHQALMGGMGEVYLCLDEKENYPYALKTFQGSDLRMRKIFEDEVTNWIALEKHPNIVRCFRMETVENVPFMFLEWVASLESRGTDLRSWLRRGPLDLPLALRFTIDIVRGLMHANEKSPGIVHCDLKPDNVLVNENRQAKITDFGLATVAQLAQLSADEIDAADMGQSRYAGNIVGTPAYVPPEQWRGEINLDFRTDMYAVGCILYELLTGRWLYTGMTIAELRQQHLEAPLPGLDGAEIEVNHILEGCLAKRREGRYERLERLLDDLKRVYEAHSDEPLPEVNAGIFTAVDYNNRGLTFANLGQHERAIQDHDAAIRLNPGYALAFMNRGNSYAALGESERAIQDHDAAIRLDPAYVPAYTNRGLTFVNLGQHERAIQDHDAAIRLDPTFAPAYYNRGNSYAALGRLERAIQDYDAAIRLDPAYAPAYANRGIHYANLGQHERAIADFDEAIRLDPESAICHLNRASLYAKLNQVKKSLDDYTTAIELVPDLGIAYLQRANILMNLGNLKSALSDLTQAECFIPEDPEIYSQRGIIYRRLKQYELAISEHTHALNLDRSNPHYYSNRGNAYSDIQQFQNALLDHNTAIEIAKESIDGQFYRNRGATYYSMGNINNANDDYTQAIELNPSDSLSYVYRGDTYIKMRMYENAIADYKKALQIDSNFLSAHLALGRLFGNQGNYTDALIHFEIAAKLGSAEGAHYAIVAREALGRQPHNAVSSDLQAAFEAFQQAGSQEGMRQVVGQFPILRQLIPTIEQFIRENVPPEHKPALEQRLAWLRQIVEG
ncbi:MAG: tetratricopeptide repeat protein [Anaerolineae bacterium]|nr:tetratricopeptide repeat protein [Anaerolineae bacterium]